MHIPTTCLPTFRRIKLLSNVYCSKSFKMAPGPLPHTLWCNSREMENSRMKREQRHFFKYREFLMTQNSCVASVLFVKFRQHLSLLQKKTHQCFKIRMSQNSSHVWMHTYVTFTTPNYTYRKTLKMTHVPYTENKCHLSLIFLF